MDKELARKKEIEQMIKEETHVVLNRINSYLAEIDFLVRRQQPINLFFTKIEETKKLLSEVSNPKVNLDQVDNENYRKRISIIYNNLNQLQSFANKATPVDSYIELIDKTKEVLAEAEAVIERIDFNFN